MLGLELNQMYVDTLIQIMCCFFALNHTNYSRWLPVHIRDMQELPVKHPNIASEFESGKFIVQKTTHAFSAMGLGQGYKQNNEMVKGDGGAIGLLESPQVLHRWMIGGPEIAQFDHEFETNVHTATPEQIKHHDQVKSHQKKFQSHVEAMVETISELGNPFSDDGKELVNLSSKDVADVSIVKTVNEIKKVGLK